MIDAGALGKIQGVRARVHALWGAFDAGRGGELAWECGVDGRGEFYSVVGTPFVEFDSVVDWIARGAGGDGVFVGIKYCPKILGG